MPELGQQTPTYPRLLDPAFSEVLVSSRISIPHVLKKWEKGWVEHLQLPGEEGGCQAAARSVSPSILPSSICPRGVSDHNPTCHLCPGGHQSRSTPSCSRRRYRCGAAPLGAASRDVGLSRGLPMELLGACQRRREAGRGGQSPSREVLGTPRQDKTREQAQISAWNWAKEGIQGEIPPSCL